MSSVASGEDASAPGDRAARYLARRDLWQFIGHVRRRDRTALWNALCGLLREQHGRILPLQIEDAAHPPAAAAPRDRLMAHVREVVNRLFVPLDNTPEEMNLTAAAWTRIPWGALSVLDEMPAPNACRRIGASVRHGRHTIRLYMLWRSELVPRPQVAQISYEGPQRFHTVTVPGLWVDQEVADLGTLMLSNDLLQARDSSDISELLAAADDTEREQLDRWRCAICSDGIDNDKNLMAAHPPLVDTEGRHVMHVFHQRCLQNLRRSEGAWADVCPTCKQHLRPRSLPEVWRPQLTVLNARMGVALNARKGINPYTVAVQNLQPGVGV